MAAFLFAFLTSGAGELAAQSVAITELLASNATGLRDADGDDSDWIEIHNAGADAVDLSGWELTETPGEAGGWPFPAGTSLPPGGFLVVFASGKDRRTPGEELHTHFKLTADGERIALTTPEGIVVHEYDPYPPQRNDISYGIAQTVDEIALVGEGASLSWFVPADDSLGVRWTAAEFDDDSWSSGAAAMGFDTAEGGPLPGEDVNLAQGGTASQSSTGFGGDAALAIDGNKSGVFGNGSITHTTNEPGAWWEVDLGAEEALDRVVLWNRTDCCSHRLTSFRLVVLDAARDVVTESEHFLDQGFPDTQDYEIALTPSTRGQFVRIEKLGPDQEGEFYLSLAEVEVFAGISSFDPLIATDVEGSMLDINASIYVRFPFDVGSPNEIELLELTVRYDDGFVLWLNGVELARRNAPERVLWNSAASSEREKADATSAELIDLTPFRSELHQGRNALAVQVLNAAVSDGDLLFDAALAGRSIELGTARYLLEPTPGAPNAGPSVAGFVEDTKFTRDRGFYDAPFDVEITTTTPGAVIRYTIDGSAPTLADGALYEGPLGIETTMTLRAAAFGDDLQPSNVDTHTYIFPADVILQSGAGFPASWGGTAADYRMDPNVYDAPAYRDTIIDDLQTIPALSIVMDTDDLFGPRGLYSNTQGRGEAWERACSMELVYPDGWQPPADWNPPGGRTGFQQNCGIRIFGFGWRAHSASLKHAFRLLFKQEYGKGKLEYPFFPGWRVERFDGFVLRSQGSRSWNDFRTSIEGTQYIRDAFARYTAREMGKVTTASTYVHLYLNGLYWGLYNPVERPNAQYMAEHHGGDPELYDALNARVGNIEVIDGSRADWDRLIALARGGVGSLDDYRAVGELVDVPDLIDYMMINFYTGNRDWVGSNGNNMRVAGGPGVGVGYKAFCWDMEYSIWAAGDNVLSVRTDHDTPAAVHAGLRANPEYRLLFADHAHAHLLNGGALTPERTEARWLDRATEIDRAIVGESARWGDRRREPPYTRDVEWVRERNRLLTSFFPQRTDIFLEQLRQVGLYTRLDPPRLSQHGGHVDAGFALSMSAAAGTILYTLDGSDPRFPGGEISATALDFGGTESTVIVAEGNAARWLVPTDGSLGLDWVAPAFDDSAWASGSGPFGHEQSSGYEDLIETDLGEAMYRESAAVFVRIPFDASDEAVAALSLFVRYDDGFVAWLNGVEVASGNAPAEPAWDSVATGSHGDSLAVFPEEFDLTAHVDLVQSRGNVLGILGLNRSSTNGDFLLAVELTAFAPPEGADDVILDRTTRVEARAWRAGEWSAVAEAVFDVPGLRITEVFYHPDDPAANSPFDEDDFEYVELKNIGAVPLDLIAAGLGGGIGFEFVAGDVTLLGPGEVAVVVKNRAAFASRFGGGVRIAGEYMGNLGNGGDRVELRGSVGESIHEFFYDDAWYPETDGGGRSLVIVDEAAAPDSWSEPASWQPSAIVGGTPGVHGESVGGLQRIGDGNQDGSVDISDAVFLLLHLFAGGGALPCGDGTLESEGNRVLLDSNGDASVNLADGVYLLNYLFAGGAPPAGGTECTPVPGCGSACLP